MRKDPRISVAKLGEYLTATPRRRRSIISDQKKPRDFIVIWYKEARKAIVECILDGCNPEVLENAMLTLEATLEVAREDSNDAARAQVSMDAIEAFASKVIDDLDLPEQLEKGDRHGARLSIGGVDVSVVPDIVVRTDVGVGSIILYFNKTNPLDDRSGAYVAALAHQFVEAQLADLGAPDRAACQVIDVLQGTTYTAPKSYRSRRKDIEAACQEIAAVWPGL